MLPTFICCDTLATSSKASNCTVIKGGAMSSRLQGLETSNNDSTLAHYAEVLKSLGAPPIEVQLDVDGKGKGLVATRDISEGETVFTERPLVSLQHTENKAQLVCHLCLRFIGTVERQIGHKLSCLVDDCKAAYRQAAPENDATRVAGDGDSDDDNEVDLEGALEAGERLEQLYSYVSRERIQDLSSGAERLPLTEDFQLPHPVPCRRGCGDLYCSSACEEESWQHSHCLLCTAAPPATTQPSAAAGCSSDPAAAGPSTVTASLADPSLEEPAAASAVDADAGAGSSSGCGSGSAGPSSSTTAREAEEASCSSSSSSSAAAAAAAETTSAGGKAGPVEELYGIRVDRRAMAAFAQHARETNEIFLLAAQVVAATLLRAAKALQHTGSMTAPSAPAQDSAAAAAATSSCANAPSEGSSAAAAVATCSSSGVAKEGATAEAAALSAAWRPYQFAWKRCWWEAVAVPDDVEDEEEFRGQLRELASDSLELLSAAISDPRFGPDLLNLQVYGSIVGMFELNNLGLSVSSPVEDFFLAVDEMEEGAEKEAVVRVTQPLLDALDSDYATPCEATAFLAIQSCINHSCDPNCTAACDTGDRTVTVLAQRDIPAGEEITLSYIDVSLPYKQRQAQLADYGFVCRCSRCTAEAAAARARRGASAKGGVKIGRRR
ncbi:hypothetical protein Agub_g131 [Astrephomene gubernaculifera]|uniref:SET domain-containing protein n=1 Tax=Astrephomene gubernaculifera TaxID=47775 RepID=A0AAD3DDC2_9CHLO|nr:hypothetical protein Agub_g131 [Astrephomene gubernaculifera]